MRFVIGAVGRLKSGPERELFERYVERVLRAGRVHGLGPIDLVEIPEDRSGNAEVRKLQEGRSLLERCGSSDLLYALDERGESLNSDGFADQLRVARDDGLSKVAFLIGGADGHGEDVRRAAGRLISFGQMTLPHGLVRVVLAEQIYRALTIISKHPYHRA